MKNFTKDFLLEFIKTIQLIDHSKINQIAIQLKKVKMNHGRVFFLGVGGSAGNASHAVNDFRKICEIESYSPTDNVSELTARINDDGWDTSYRNWLTISKLSNKDVLFIFSVGGGSKNKNVSLNLIEAIKLAKSKKCKIFGITGPDGGYTKKNANICITIPIINKKNLTAITESFQVIIWHILVSHPALKKNSMKWESLI